MTVQYNGYSRMPDNLYNTFTSEDVIEAKQLFKQFQVTEYDHEIHHNLPINSYEWEVLVLDIREKGDRYCYLREVTPHRDKYNVVVYCHKFESDVLENVEIGYLTFFKNRIQNSIKRKRLLLLRTAFSL